MKLVIKINGSGTRGELIDSLAKMQASLAKATKPDWSYDDKNIFAKTAVHDIDEIGLGRAVKAIVKGWES